ncbi:cytochrome P450 [Obelidium mucronatum]|nr:cytochrome P450 [Obelidium mucronatum]
MPHNWLHRNKFGPPFSESESGLIAFCEPAVTTVFVGDPDFAREIMMKRHKELIKPIQHYKLFDLYGKNILTTEGEEWRKHRKIAAPTFSEQTHMSVHQATIQTVSDMFNSWTKKLESDGASVVVNVSREMKAVALSVMASAAFGIDVLWDDDNTAVLENGYEMTFKESLEIVVDRLGYWLAVPRFLYWLPIKSLRRTRTGFIEFERYLDGIVAQAQRVEKPKNLLQMLAKAAADETDAGVTLSKEELKGNSFIFLFAGHETTASTMAFALALLAVHKDKQEALYADIKETLGDSNIFEYSDFSKLKYCLAIMNETLRMYPSVPNIPKFTASETVSLGPFVFPPETSVCIATPALHFNPKVWGNDVHEFRPERFLGTDESGRVVSQIGFAPFSEGPRGCLGKKFAQVEFVTTLVMICLKYRIEVPAGVDAREFLETTLAVNLMPKTPIKLQFVARE